MRNSLVPGAETATATCAMRTPTSSDATTPVATPTPASTGLSLSAGTTATSTRLATPRGTATSARSPTPTLSPTVTPVPVSTPQWEVLSNGNYVNAVIGEGQTVWAASDGGVVAWNLQSGQASKFTNIDGLSSNAITAAAYCPIATLGVVFGSVAGLQVFDLRSGGWRTLNSANSPMSFDNVRALYCNADVFCMRWIGLDIFDANAAEWSYIGLDEIGPIHALTADDALAQVWVGGDAGVALVEDGDVTLYSSQNSPPPLRL
ncbi:MAG: hypothetical protein H6641_21225 [Caldilineaceae bacterium]|nr:hypothetical protein [Caldilineaceae bacterium]